MNLRLKAREVKARDERANLHFEQEGKDDDL